MGRIHWDQLVVCIGFMLSIILSPNLQAKDNRRSKEVNIRGSIVTLDQSENAYPAELKDDLTVLPLFGMNTVDGKLYLFLPEDPKTKIFTDPRIRERELQVKAWKRSENQLEIIDVYSVRDGEVYDLYYRCDLCNITTDAPGPCWCCQREFELRETSLGKGR